MRSERRQNWGSAASWRARATATARASPGRDDAVDEADGEGLGRRHGAAGEDEVHGAAVADDPGQAHRAEVAQRDPEAAAEDAEDGVLGGDAQVAPQRQLDPAGDGVALDRRDDGLGERETGGAHGPGSLVGDGPAVALGHRLEVGAGAERTLGPGEDGDGLPVVGVEGQEGLAQLVGADAVDGVAALGAVDGDDGDRAFPLDEQGVGPVGAVGGAGGAGVDAGGGGRDGHCWHSRMRGVAVRQMGAGPTPRWGAVFPDGAGGAQI